jgi:pentatricopeptide repeat protein
MSKNSGKWVKKMMNRKLKTKQFFRFSVDHHFASPDEVPASATDWGMEATRAEFHEQFGIDIPKEAKNNAVAGYVWCLSQKPMNHFLAYQYFKKLKPQDTVNLIPLLKSISTSSILHAEVRHLRVKLVSERIVASKQELTREYWVYLGLGLRELIQTKQDALEFIKEANWRTPDILQPIVQGLCLNQQPDAAMDLIQPHISKWNEDHFFRVTYPIFEAYIKSDLEKAMKFVEKFISRGLMLHPLMGNYLLEAIVDQDVSDASDWIPKIIQWMKKCKPLSPGTYRILLSYYKDKDPEFLKKLEAEITDLGYDLTGMKVRLELMEAVDGELEEADVLMKSVLKSRTYLIEYPVLDKFMNAHIDEVDAARGKESKNDQMGRSCALANVYHMRNHALKLYHTNKTFLRLLDMFAQNENAKRCLSLVKKINRRGLGATSDHYYYLVDAYCARGSVLLAKEMIDDMYRNKLKPSIQIYNRWIQAYLDQRKPNYAKAISILKQLPALNQPLSQSTFELFYQKLRKNPTVEDTTRFMETLIDLKVQPSATPFNLCMLAHFKKQNYDRVFEYYDKILSTTAKPDSESFEILIQCYLAEDNLDMAISTFEEMTAEPSEKSSVMIFNCLKKTRQFQKIDEIWARLAQNKTFTGFVVDAYLHCLLHQERYAEMQEIALALIKDEVYPSVSMLQQIRNRLDEETRRKWDEQLWKHPLLAKQVMGIPVLHVESDSLAMHSRFVFLLNEYKRIRVASKRRAREPDLS